MPGHGMVHGMGRGTPEGGSGMGGVGGACGVIRIRPVENFYI